jgi:MerR family transcriptional regulator, light-induced transcriptional regulator
MTGHLRIGTVAARTGVSEAVLRMWERRYGFPRPQRTGANYRTYSEDEIALINRIVSLIQEGLSASEAIGSVLAEKRPRESGAASFEEAIDAFWDGAREMDHARLERVIDRAESMFEVGELCDRFFMPILGRMTDELDVAREHFASSIIRQHLRTLLQDRVADVTAAPVILACPPEEAHEGGILGVGLHLMLAGISVLVLGANTPVSAIVGTAQQKKAKAVALSFIQPRDKTYVLALLREIANAIAPVPLIAGGPVVKPLAADVASTGAHFAGTAADLIALAEDAAIAQSSR